MENKCDIRELDMEEEGEYQRRYTSAVRIVYSEAITFALGLMLKIFEDKSGEGLLDMLKEKLTSAPSFMDEPILDDFAAEAWADIAVQKIEIGAGLCDEIKSFMDQIGRS